ncbi:MAG: inovirus Gp2 family protein [Gammaproteobacteria bacterium]|nr:inovirus Gp2 family protein [Gammaproteobacteria bacterium]
MALSSSNYVISGKVGYYKGYTVNTGHTVDTGILNRFISVLDSAMSAYNRVFAFRVDLRLPVGLILTPEMGHRLIDRFIASFKEKVRSNRAAALKLNPNAHNTDVRYCWAREVNLQGGVHYHLVFFLNRDAFNSLGSFKAASGNTYTRLVEAWASALGIAVKDAAGLVHVAVGGMFHLDLNSTNYAEIKDQVVHNLSYMAKQETKVPGCGLHRYGASRK